jgi:hypothetical protein
VREDIFEIRGVKYVDLNGGLFELACQFRSVRHNDNCDELRKQIAQQYAQEVDRLIATRRWNYAPNFDEMLTDEYMPPAFKEYWDSDVPGNIVLEDGPSMTKYDALYSDLNKLLSHLESFDVVKLVEEHFAQYNNPAPPLLLRKVMNDLQKRLDEAPDAETPD